MLAGLVLLSQTRLLFKNAYGLSAAARWTLVGRGHSISMPADILPFNIATHTAGMVSHYHPCLLVWSLTIGHIF